jgi:hypothetical protein
MRRIILVSLCAAALCSCVGVESHLTIGNDGSGTLALDYRVPREMAVYGRADGADLSVPLPVDRADFQRAIEGISGVRLTRYSRREKEDSVAIHAVIAFQNLADLARVPALRDAGFAFAESGKTRTLQQVVAGSPGERPTAESLALIDALSAGSAITVVLSTPSPMTPGAVGTLSTDRRTLTWTGSLGDLARRTGSVVLTATW